MLTVTHSTDFSLLKQCLRPRWPNSQFIFKQSIYYTCKRSRPLVIIRASLQYRRPNLSPSVHFSFRFMKAKQYSHLCSRHMHLPACLSSGSVRKRLHLLARVRSVWGSSAKTYPGEPNLHAHVVLWEGVSWDEKDREERRRTVAPVEHRGNELQNLVLLGVAPLDSEEGEEDVGDELSVMISMRP